MGKGGGKREGKGGNGGEKKTLTEKIEIEALSTRTLLLKGDQSATGVAVKKKRKSRQGMKPNVRDG